LHFYIYILCNILDQFLLIIIHVILNTEMVGYCMKGNNK